VRGDDERQLGKSSIGLAAKGFNTDGAIVFGWQFRPTLGDDYVKDGIRYVYAQVALDTSTSNPGPAVFLQTRWRAYDKKRDVVGEVYRNSCTWREVSNFSLLNSDPTVTDTSSVDLGGGNVRILARGQFSDPALQLRFGGNLRTPDVVTQDTQHLDIVVPSTWIFSAPAIGLIGTSGNETPLQIKLASGETDKCQVSVAKAYATPFPDGTSLITIDLEYGEDRKTSEIPDPMVAVNNVVYGLHDHPYVYVESKTTDVAGQKHTREIQFRVSTDAINSSPVVAVRDFGWTAATQTGTMGIDPTFVSMQLLAKTSASSSGDAPGNGWYRLTGTNLQLATITPKCDGRADPCLDLYVGGDRTNASLLDSAHFKVLNDTEAYLNLDVAPSGPLHFLWTHDKTTSEWSIDVATAKAPDSKIVANPSKLKQGDSLTVQFTGADFSGISAVTFEDGSLRILSQDKKTMTILVTTKVTNAAGTKNLIATGADGKPVILSIDVDSSK
jgi:hypothetical protein